MVRPVSQLDSESRNSEVIANRSAEMQTVQTESPALNRFGPALELVAASQDELQAPQNDIFTLVHIAQHVDYYSDAAEPPQSWYQGLYSGSHDFSVVDVVLIALP